MDSIPSMPAALFYVVVDCGLLAFRITAPDFLCMQRLVDIAWTLQDVNKYVLPEYDVKFGGAEGLLK